MDAANGRQIVGGHKVDPIGHHRRLGLPIGAEIPDSLIVESARNKDTESARLICQVSVQRLDDIASSEAEKQLLKLLTKFVYSETAPHIFDSEALPFDIADALNCIARPKIQSALGTGFSGYLSECFRASAQSSDIPISAAFNLRLAKGEGRSIEIERNFEIAEGVEAIRQTLKQGKLKDRVQRFFDGNSPRIPSCIERHLRIHGHSSHEISVHRYRLATALSRITSDNCKNVGVAAKIYVECMKVRVTILREIIDDGLLPTNERTRLEDQIDFLNSYGAVGRGRGNQGIGLSGVKSIHKRYVKKLHTRTANKVTFRSNKESARLLAFEDPAIRQAVEVIDSPNVGNHNRAELLKLQKRTPDEYQFMWVELWGDFQERALAAAMTKGEAQL